MRSNSTKKLAIAAIFVALAVVGSAFVSFPVFGSKCSPTQHMVNVLCAVFLGPGYGVGVAFCASLIRNLVGAGTLMAFPGSMVGALCCGLAACGSAEGGKTTICTAQWERIGNKTEDSSAYYTKADDGTVKIESVDQDELKKQLETDSTAQIDVSGLEAEKVTLPVSAVNDVLALEAKALSIKMADAAITLDKTAMQSVVETADGNDI